MVKSGKPRKRKTIVLDLDGTLIEYGGWKGDEHFGKPLPGAVEATRLLDWLGYDVVICTARERLDLVRRHVAFCGFTCKDVTNRKPPAVVYVDDRAVRHISWPETLALLAEMLVDSDIMLADDLGCCREVACG